MALVIIVIVIYIYMFPRPAALISLNERNVIHLLICSDKTMLGPRNHHFVM